MLVTIPGAGHSRCNRLRADQPQQLPSPRDHSGTCGLDQQRRGIPTRQLRRCHVHSANPIPATSRGLSASNFTASIDWGDPSPDPSAGTVIQDASNPSVYYITGTHTFTENGTYTVNSSAALTAGSYAVYVLGIPIWIPFGPVAATPVTPATATVSQGTLAVSAFPIVGTAGNAIAAGPIATFIDAGGADPVGNYSATIAVTNSSGTTVVSLPAASISQNGNAAQFTVNAPAFTLPEQGTYKVVVTVTDNGGATPIAVDGAFVRGHCRLPTHRRCPGHADWKHRHLA